MVIQMVVVDYNEFIIWSQLRVCILEYVVGNIVIYMGVGMKWGVVQNQVCCCW